MNSIRRGKSQPTARGFIRTTVMLAMAVWIANGQIPDGSDSGTALGPTSSIITARMAVAGFPTEMIFNAGAGTVIKRTLRDDVTSSTIANPALGQFLTLLLCPDAAGSRNLVWPTNVRLSGGEFILTQPPLRCDALTMVYDGITWYEISRVMNE